MSGTKQDHICIIGAGILGLSTAHFLVQQGLSRITILESSGRVGGKVHTQYVDGYTIEESADSFITGRPEMERLLSDLDLEREVIYPLTSSFLIRLGHQFYPAPRGIRGIAPLDPKLIMESGIFTHDELSRAMQEASLPLDENWDWDQVTIGQMVRDRFGEAWLDKYVNPLFGGIYSAHCDQLSLASTFPAWLAQLKQYGSITKATKELAFSQTTEKEGSTGNRSPFAGLRTGMGQLISALEKRLLAAGVSIQCQSAVEAVQYADYAFEVRIQGREILKADQLVVTTPAKPTAAFLAGIMDSSDYMELPHSSSYILSVAGTLPNKPLKQHITGFVSDNQGLTSNIPSSMTFSSLKWAERTPEGKYLIRFFFKEMPSAVKNLVSIESLLKELLGIEATSLEQTHFTSWQESLPVYDLKAKELNSRLQNRVQAIPNLYVAGAYLRGVGIPDTVKKGYEIAESISKKIPTTALGR